MFIGFNIRFCNFVVGGIGSNFFLFCYKMLMKFEDNMDIVFFEFLVNDYLFFKDFYFLIVFFLEEFIRELLSE